MFFNLESYVRLIKSPAANEKFQTVDVANACQLITITKSVNTTLTYGMAILKF